ncbi:hypothetical protein D3C84_273240 [compost metagenome]
MRRNELPRFQLRFRQGLAVQLAVRRQRHGLQAHQPRRHHVVRQLGLQPLAQAAEQFVAALGHHVAHQLLLARHHRRFAHRRVRQQTGFDLAELDAEAANLHLLVDPPQVFQGAIGPPAHQVAGAVQALAAAEGVGDEAFGGQPRTLVVTPRQAFATDVQLAGHAQRQWLQVVVQHVQRGVGQGFAEEHLRLLFVEAVARRPDGGFRGPVEVPQLAGHPDQGARQVRRQRFAAAEHLPPGQFRQARMLGQQAPGRRRGLDRADALLGDLRPQALRIAGGVAVDQHHAGAADQRQVQLQRGDIEGQRGQRQHPALRRQPRCLGHAGEEVAETGATHRHAFRLAGGAGGVDHIGQVFARGQGRRVAFRRGEGEFVEQPALGVGAQRLQLALQR